jgi:hypothetical protein
MPGWYDHFETGFHLKVIRAKLGDGVRQLYPLTNRCLTAWFVCRNGSTQRMSVDRKMLLQQSI